MKTPTKDTDTEDRNAARLKAAEGPGTFKSSPAPDDEDDVNAEGETPKEEAKRRAGEKEEAMRRRAAMIRAEDQKREDDEQKRREQRLANPAIDSVVNTPNAPVSSSYADLVKAANHGEGVARGEQVPLHALNQENRIHTKAARDFANDMGDAIGAVARSVAANAGDDAMQRPVYGRPGEGVRVRKPLRAPAE